MFDLDSTGDCQAEGGGRDIVGLEVENVGVKVVSDVEEKVLEGRLLLVMFVLVNVKPLLEKRFVIVWIGKALGEFRFINKEAMVRSECGVSDVGGIFFLLVGSGSPGREGWRLNGVGEEKGSRDGCED
jgi:hypothetical protein